MTSVTDLASKTVSHWDMLGRVTHVAKKVASPGGSLDESVHVWQSRLYGPLFQLGWLGGVVGGGAVGAGYGLISGENVGHAAMTSGYYSHPFEESAYQAEGSYPSDHAEDWGLVPGMMRW